MRSAAKVDNKRVDDSIVSNIKESLDIVSVISDYLSLKRTGQNYHSLCPFHHEKTPSFVVNPKKQIFHCFGCGEGGDLFKFIMKMDGLSFPEALKSLADRAGIRHSLHQGDAPDNKLAMFSIMEKVAGFYCSVLLKNSNAVDYLKKRKISNETVEKFTIGFAPDAWSQVCDRFGRSEKNLKMLLSVGLIIKKDNRYYDRFRNRIVFPIRDGLGRVIGFGGRVLDESLPKYLNSPETILFNKSKTLFGLDKVISSRSRMPVFLVEGYMDLIMAHQYGVTNVFATLGTACTEQHFRKIKRITSDVVLVFDGDSAGEKAAERSLASSINAGIYPKVVHLPRGEDPDSYLRKFGKESFLQLGESSPYLMDYVVNKKIGRIKDLPINDKNEALEELISSVSILSSPIEQQRYVKLIAEGININEGILGDLLDKTMAYKRRKTFKKDARGRERVGFRAISIPKEEEILIHLILHDMLDMAVINKIDTKTFTTPLFRDFLGVLADSDNMKRDADQKLDIAYLCENIGSSSQESMNIISGLLMREVKYDNIDDTVRDCISVLEKKFVQQVVLKDIEKKINQEADSGNFDAVARLQKEQLRLKLSIRK